VIDGAVEIRALQSELLNVFKDLDGDYNPDVKAILFEDDPSCSVFTAADPIAKCQDLIKMGQPNNMVSAIAVYEGIFATKERDFMNVDKSSVGTLLAAVYRYLPVILPNAIVITYQAQAISDIINSALETRIEEIQDTRLVILGVFAFCLFIAGVFIWLHILKKIREVQNDFKKVLQILPPGLILSSYLLKKFLMDTSSNPTNLL